MSKPKEMLDAEKNKAAEGHCERFGETVRQLSQAGGAYANTDQIDKQKGENDEIEKMIHGGAEARIKNREWQESMVLALGRNELCADLNEIEKARNRNF